jgi:hypothetical protein
MKTEVRCNMAPWSRGSVQVAVLAHHLNGQTFLAKPLVMQLIEDHALITEPTMTLAREVAQQLMDELWTCGLRPTEGSGSAGSLAATERHLKDMQTIAMGLLKPQGVEQ